MIYQEARRNIDRSYWRFRFGRINIDTLKKDYEETRDELSFLKRGIDEKLFDWPINSAAVRLGIEMDRYISSATEALNVDDAAKTRAALRDAYGRADRIVELAAARENIRTVRDERPAIEHGSGYVRLLLNAADQHLLQNGRATKAVYLNKLASGLMEVRSLTLTEPASADAVSIADLSSVNQGLQETLDRLCAWLRERGMPPKK